MNFASDYEEAVYAGVLGKIIGVYLGRPFEGWDHRRIMSELGPIEYYVHDRLGVPLVVTDDDIAGTFAFVRAMEDNGCDPGLTPQQIGQAWLNYLVEGRSILWWGGMGNSTEHTAYLRLKSGHPAPESGSAMLNSKIVAEQIGAQIFIDAWAMLCPGDVELAADLARRAASVSHDGEAIYGAQVVAAIEAGAFVEKDMGVLLDQAVRLIPSDSVIYRLIADLRALRLVEPDWMKAREFIEKTYGYDQYGGNCHIVPNHALIMLALLWGDDNFQKSLMIVNTSGWDTDCNSGNVGCILGLKNGLAGLDDGPDFRGPVADRFFLCTADGGGVITDALRQSTTIANTARTMRGLGRIAPKGGARFTFHLPGAVQGFRVQDGCQTTGAVTVENAEFSTGAGRGLAIRFDHLAAGCPLHVVTPTFIPVECAQESARYGLLASPTLYPGQVVRAQVLADVAIGGPVSVALCLRHYDGSDQLIEMTGQPVSLSSAEPTVLEGEVPDCGGQPIAEIGLCLTNDQLGRSTGTVYVDWLTWDGAPRVRLGRPIDGGTMWRKAWVDAVDAYPWEFADTYRIVQNQGTGLLTQGGRDWHDYSVTARVMPHMGVAFGLAIRVQGLRRYYALKLGMDHRASLVKIIDDDLVLLGESQAVFEWGTPLTLRVDADGSRIRAWVDDVILLDVDDLKAPLLDGAVGLLIEEGRLGCDWVEVTPVSEPVGA